MLPDLREDLQRAARRQVEARLDSEARWFVAALTAMQGAYAVFLGLSPLIYKMNYVPLAASALGLAARCSVLLLVRADAASRRLRANPQVCLGFTFCFDGILAGLVNPEVQFQLYQRIPSMSMFGKPPGCSLEHDGACFKEVDTLQTMLLLLITFAFGIIFILRFRHAVWAMSSGFIFFQLARATVLGTRFLRPDILLRIGLPFILLAILLAAKRKIEGLLQHVFLDLVEGQREVVQEKVKRCQMEFALEQSGVLHEGDSAMRALSLRGSAAPSSQGAFSCGWGEEEESPLGKLQQLASWGRREHWLVNPLHLTLDPHKVLGQGSFGTVVSGCLAGTPVAVKLLRKHGPDASLRELANELRIFRHLRHPGIALFHGACLEPELGALGLVLELVEGLSLQKYVETTLSNSEETESLARWSLMLDISRALHHLHALDPPIVHGDVKPANIMVEQMRVGPRAKLLDFGLSRIVSPQAGKLGGTWTWMAPEVRDGTARAPRAAADVYSYGMTAYFIVSGIKPAWRPLSWPPGPFSVRSQILTVRCLRKTPELRISMAVVHEDLQTWPQELGMPAQEPCCSPGMPWLEALRVLRISAEDLLRRTPPPAVERRIQEGAAEDLQRPQPSPAVEERAQEGRPRADASGQELRGLPPSLAGCAPTPTRTKVMMLMDVLARSYTPPQASRCCNSHNAVEDLFLALQMLRDVPCSFNLFYPERHYVQCPKCLAVRPAEEDGVPNCDVCSFVNSGLSSDDGLSMGTEAAHDVMPL